MKLASDEVFKIQTIRDSRGRFGSPRLDRVFFCRNFLNIGILPNIYNGGTQGGREDTALHLEMFYRARITDNISLTPGVLVVFDPNQNSYWWARLKQLSNFKIHY